MMEVPFNRMAGRKSGHGRFMTAGGPVALTNVKLSRGGSSSGATLYRDVGVVLLCAERRDACASLSAKR